jgi:hypothetical protein
MLSFKQFISEGVFSVHNGVVLHKHLVDHIQNNIDEVHKKVQKGEAYKIKASDVHESLPKDLDIIVKWIHKKEKSKIHNDGMFYANFEPNRHILAFGIHTPSLKKNNLLNSINTPSVQSLFVHEHNHYEDYKDILKKHGKKAADIDHEMSVDAMTHNSPKEYYNDPGEVRSFNRELALQGRALNKKEPTLDTSKILGRMKKKTKDNFPDYIEHAKPENIEPVKQYFDRITNKNPTRNLT